MRRSLRSRPRGGGLLRRPRPPPGRLADRLRLGHGRVPVGPRRQVAEAGRLPGWAGRGRVAPPSYALGMTLTSTRLTAEEYFALPPTEHRTQLINGEIVVTE